MTPDALLPGAKTVDDLLSKGHRAIFGRTGGGKSKLTQHDFHRSALHGFYVNPHKERLQARHVASPHEVKRLFAEGHRRLHWCPPRAHEVKDGQDGVKRLLSAMQQPLFDGGRAMMEGDKADAWCQVVYDEAQLFTQKTGGLGPVESLLSEGRKFGLRCTLASQRPSRVSLEALGQVDLVFMFDLATRDLDYLEKEGFAVPEFQTHIRKPFHFVAARDNGDWCPFIPFKLKGGGAKQTN